ncbi:MAG: class I SAM-dependent methyltransferase [Merismopediaceae bacterium]|nr:class I SAM-dependent methyltransferase [Merismopediaceae bacterium]
MIKKLLKKLRAKLLGLAEVENLFAEKLSLTNSALTDSVSEIKTALSEYSTLYRRQIDELKQQLEQDIKLLSEPEKMVPLLNARTGRYYLSLEYPPSRHYTRRWTDNNPHQGLIKLFERDFEEQLNHSLGLAKLYPYFEAISLNISEAKNSEPAWLGGAINAVDSAFLYYFIATYKPKIYLEIGSGVTTLFAARAKRDHHLNTQIISLDPQPRYEVDQVCDRVIRQGLELADLSIFSQLEPGDIVFMDGSHRSFMNSDVTVFMLDILPYLKPGVLIHFHDIVLPYDYPETFDAWYWNEQYILATYLLAAQEKLKIVMPSQFVCRTPAFQQLLQNTILPHWSGPEDVWYNGGSLWFTHHGGPQTNN